MTMRIMLVEDDSLHRTFLRSAVEAALPDGSEIFEADDGASAVRIVADNDISAVVLDLQMPGMNGVEAAKNIWAKHPEAKILFWSNHSDEAYVRWIAKIVPPGAVYGYTLKSASEDRLQLAIQGVFVGEQCVIDREVRGLQRRMRGRSDLLTEVEHQVLLDLCLGLTDKAMAARRNMSLRTLQATLQILYSKLGLEKGDLPAGEWGASFNPRTRAVYVGLARGLLNLDAVGREASALSEWMDRTGQTNRSLDA